MVTLYPPNPCKHKHRGHVCYLAADHDGEHKCFCFTARWPRG